MNRSDIVDSVTEVLPNKAKAREVVDVMVETIQRGLVEEGRVHISGLGSFVGEQVPSRMVRNPATGKKVRAKKSGRVRFRPATDMKELLAGRKRLSKKKVKQS